MRPMQSAKKPVWGDRLPEYCGQPGRSGNQRAMACPSRRLLFLLVASIFRDPVGARPGEDGRGRAVSRRRAGVPARRVDTEAHPCQGRCPAG